MGLFDKKRRDDFDSPVEVIDLSRGTTPETASAPPSPGVRAAPPPEPESDYGIDRAIELMRTLPPDNVELVVRVVKLALESARVKVTAILEDAAAKLARLEGRVATLRSEIAELESEIGSRRKEIEGLEADHKETSLVRDRLQLAEKLSTGAVAKTAAPAAAPAASATAPALVAPRK
jgi:hypothetical protein